MRSRSNSDWMRAREAGRRYTHPSDTLPTPLLSQRGKTPLELASTDEVKAAFAAVSEEAEEEGGRDVTDSDDDTPEGRGGVDEAEVEQGGGP